MGRMGYLSRVLVLLLSSLSMQPAVATKKHSDVLNIIYGSMHRDGRVTFPRIDPSWLSDGDTNLYLRIRAKDDKAFPIDQVEIGLNGQKACGFGYKGVASSLAWETTKDGRAILWVNLSQLKFGEATIEQRLMEIQGFSGKVQFWIKTPKSFYRPRLVFVRGKVHTPYPKHPTVRFDSISPSAFQFAGESIEFKFSSPEGATQFQCAMDLRKFSSCASPKIYSNLKPGYHLFRVRAIAPWGWKSKVQYHLFRVTEPAAKLVIKHVVPEANPTNEQSISIAFTGFAGAKYSCQLDSAKATECTSPVSYQNLSEGRHQIRITGKSSKKSASAEYLWNIDATAPAISWSATPSTTTQSSTAEFQVSANESSEFQCRLDGGEFSACQSPIRFESLAEGAHYFEVVATDPAGNRSAPLSYQWAIDQTVPVVTLTSLDPADQLTSMTEITAHFTVNEPALTICQLDDHAPEDCVSPFRASDLSNGEHRLKIWASDIVGNTSAPVTHEWTVDAIIPQATLKMLSPTQLPSNSQEAAFEFTVTDGGYARCFLDGREITPCESPLELSGIRDGERTFELVPFDEAGNEGETRSVTWDVDLERPEIYFGEVTPSESPTQSRSIQVYLEATEEVGYFCNLDDSGNVPCTSPFMANDLVDGAHRLVVVGIDVAHNLSEPIQYDWTVFSDTTAPVITQFSTVPNSNVTSQTEFTATFESNEAGQFLCKLDSGGEQPCASPFQASALGDGLHTFTVVAMDSVGNRSNPQSYSWVVDTTPLAISNVSVSQITKTSALITWNTNVPANTQVNYSSAQGSQSTPMNPAMVTDHSVLLDNLTSFTLYTFHVQSVDMENRSAQSGPFTFRTLR